MATRYITLTDRLNERNDKQFFRYVTLNERLNEMGTSKGGFIQGDQNDGVYEYADGSKISIYKNGKVIKTIEKDNAEYSKVKNDISRGKYNKEDHEEENNIDVDKKLLKDLEQLIKNKSVSQEKINKLIKGELPKNDFQNAKYKGKLFKTRIGSYRFILNKNGKPIAWDTREDIYRNTNKLDALLKKI